MSFATYDELVDTISDWLNRDDAETVARIPDFIRLAEARMQRELAPFSTRAEFALPLNASTGRTVFYPGLVGVVRVEQAALRVNDSALTFNPPRPLTHVTDATLLDWYAQMPASGRPTYYAILGQEIGVYPFPDVPIDSLGAPTTYSVILTQVGPSASFAVPITSGNFSFNPLVSEHPDLYLYGALAEAAPYLSHDERLPLWETLFRGTIRAVNLQHDRLLLGAQAPAPRLPVVFG